MAESVSYEFSVYQFFPDGSHERVRRQYVTAEQAVEVAYSYCTRPAARMGIIQRVIITDGGDHTIFEWKFGEGVVYP